LAAGARRNGNCRQLSVPLDPFWKALEQEAQYKSAKQVFEEAGLDAADGGSFRLRHTFALRQLRRGTDAVQVARWLGVEPDAMAKYRRVVTGPEQVV
jgi:hypothetical protein